MTTIKTNNLSFPEAMEALEQGHKIKLPEWTGYWFKKDGKVLVLTKQGDLLNTPHFVTYSLRDDWQITDGSLGFDFAIQALKNGKLVTRKGWNGKGMWLEMQIPDKHSKMTLAYIYLNYPEDAKTTPGARVPWAPSQTDMLAEDWELFDSPQV